MNEPARQINGDLLRQRREAKGWAPTDLATRSCLSLRQVRQIEEGGNSSFYSESVKATAARKIAALLGLPQEMAFVQALSLSTGDIPAMADQVPIDTAPTSAPGGPPARSKVRKRCRRPSRRSGAWRSSLVAIIASLAITRNRSQSLAITRNHSQSTYLEEEEEQAGGEALSAHGPVGRGWDGAPW